LNGSKTFITNAPYADVFVIYARVKSPTPDNPAREAIHAFILERGLPGLSTGQPFRKMGMHASPTGEIFMSDVRVPRANLLGGREKDPSRDQAVGVLMGERTAMPSMCLGIVERLLDECVRYSKERRQFGRPIAEFQLVQEKIAKLFVTREILEMYVHKMIWMQQNGIKSMKEASAAKLYCGRATVEAALDAVQVFGGAGYIRDAGIEMMVRDAKLFTIGGGTDEIQIGWIARELLKD
jgi:alkylation response protein AidB-like acyl-CoA dehydrogenase